MNALDQLLRDRLGSFENAANFSFAVWRESPDHDGANWNAKIQRVWGDAADTRWWEAVPALRASFSLDDEGD